MGVVSLSADAEPDGALSPSAVSKSEEEGVLSPTCSLDEEERATEAELMNQLAINRVLGRLPEAIDKVALETSEQSSSSAVCNSVEDPPDDTLRI